MSKDIISYKYYGYLVKFVKKGLDFRNIYIFANYYNPNMSKLKEKSEFNIGAAELLISNNYYAPALLFPYIRAYISTLTNLSGFETLTLPTLNMTELGNDLKNNTTQI